ncbi:MAG: Stage II sporulation protein M [Firmicutes bacterium]|nr:Stage II sporulation protein M [Bacillota bacterium]
MKNSVWLLHWRERWLAFLLVAIMFIIGIVSGAITITAVTVPQRQDLVRYINTYFESIMVGTLVPATWQSVVWGNFQVVTILWLCGLLVFGAPGILLLLFLRGFVIGFSVGFLVEEFGIRGFLFALSSIIPHSLLAVPAMVGLGASGIAFSFAVIFGVNQRTVQRRGGASVAKFSLSTVPYIILMVLAGLIEVFITPVFIRVATALF